MRYDLDCYDIPVHIREAFEGKSGKKEIAADMLKKNKRAKELLEIRLEKYATLTDLIETHPKGRLAGLDAILSNDTWAKAKNSNVEYKQKALQGYAEKFIPTLKQELSTTMWGMRRDKAKARAFVKAVIDGDKTDALAVKMANESNKLMGFLRERFNRFGGDIGKLRDGKGYLPQSHDAQAVRAVPKDEWIKYISTKLSDETMMDVDRGVLDLNYIYETITTGGLNKISESSTGGGGMGKSVANKHAEERVLDFKDGDAWLDYQEKFGGADPMATIDDHIRTMTTDMALLETLGSNPDAMFRTLVDTVKAKETLDGTKKLPGLGLDFTRKMYNVVSGKVDRDMGETALAPYLQVMRAMNTATLLNNAAISTITDPILASFTAGYVNKMNPLTTLGGYFKNIVRGMSKRTFEEEQLMGLGADVFSSQVTRRFSELGSGFWAKSSEVMMRATMMNILTESARTSFKAQYFRKLLKGRKIEDLTPDEHIKLLEAVQQEADYAVVMGNARSRALSTQGESKGTITGELSRSSTQFMTFPTTFMVMQGSRAFRQQGSLGSKAAYGATLFTILTAGGALALMGKDQSKGYNVRKGFNPFSEDNDPKDVIKFWAAAVTQGVGIGIVGDFLFSDTNRYGGGKGVTLGGPSAGLIGDAWGLTYGNVQEAFDPDNENTHFGSELVDFTNTHLNPVKSWYTRAIWEQYAIREMKMIVDEDYEKAERRKERKRRKEYDQEIQPWLKLNR